MRVEEALKNLADYEYPSNQQVIAEAIRLQLADARARDMEHGEAAEHVTRMLATDFTNCRIVVPFTFGGKDLTNHTVWTVELAYAPTGTPVKVSNEDCLVAAR